MRTRFNATLGGAAFAAFAAVCATWLSGLSFPEQNNIWTVPVVLDFAGSAEGPHDPYHTSFARFVSVFWFALRPLVNEATIQPAYVALQLAGNALVAVMLFALVRRAGGSPVRAALGVGFLCFCYGLWGATRLGYSELFSTYATHTQYAVVLTLAGLCFATSRRGGAAGAAIGIAALANLFIGVWGALACGIALIAIERRIATPAQWRFAILFLLFALPVAWWGLASGGGGAPPVAFFRTLAAGHIYAADYPQAAVQGFALALTAAIAACAAPEEPLRRLGRVAAAAVAVLGVAAAMPYVAELPVLLLLHPLRFVSVTTLLSAAVAAALLVRALDRDDRAALLPGFVAVAGFMLKLPVVSLLGFALAVPAASPRARRIAAGVAMLGILATLLPGPIDDVPLKAALCFVVAAAALATAAWHRPVMGDGATLASAGALGAAVVTLPSPVADAGLVVAALAAAACLGGARRIAIGAALVSASLSIAAAFAEPVRLAAITVAMALLLAAPLLPGLAQRRRIGAAALAGIVVLFVVAGLARGALAGFAPQPDAARRDWMAAQHWARVATPRDATFLPIGVDEGFALFARRPIWWEHSQMAAVFWAPSFYPDWLCRRAALAAAADPRARVALARAGGVAYLLVPAGDAAAYRDAGAPTAFRNGHYAIAIVPRPQARVGCPAADGAVAAGTGTTRPTAR